MRLLATFERASRLAQTFTQRICATFEEIARQVGHAFNVNKHSVDVFSESFVRSNLVFQLANCLDADIAQLREKL
jgi:hypothetical protein